jgi:hypothetical protein
MTVAPRSWQMRCALGLLAAVAAIPFWPDAVTVPLRAQSVDPCANLALTATRSTTAQAAREPKRGLIDQSDAWNHLDSLYANAAAARRRSPLSVRATRSQDVGAIAVMEDAGDMLNIANPFDLSDVAMRLRSNAAGGYDIAAAGYGFRQPLGAALVLSDDDSSNATLPFPFTFFGKSYTDVWINSDGNLTFGARDSASTERSVSRVLVGAPRIAPFFADLDPSVGGKVLTSSNPDAFTVTWCGVNAFESPDVATVQVTLFPDGAIEMHVSGRTTIREAVIGVSPGQTTAFTAADFSSMPIGGGNSAVVEAFTATSELDLVNVAKRFLGTHADEYHTLTVFTDRELQEDSFAYEITVKNNIQGLGLNLYDNAAAYGSTGALQSICNMDALSKYPEDPGQRILGEFSAVAVIAHEFGHRWLAFYQTRDSVGRLSNALLGRQNAHWNFFMDTDASVMEGNDIEDRGDGTFRTVGAAKGFSLLDQYAMGLVDKSEVPGFFYVEGPSELVPATVTSSSSPRSGASFRGTRRDLTVDDLIKTAGPRSPSTAEAPRTIRQAWVYVTSAGRTVNASEVRKLDRLRLAFEQFISEATSFRMQVDTRLIPSS